MSVAFDQKTNTWFYYGKYTDCLKQVHQYKKRGFSSKKLAQKAEGVLKQEIGDQLSPTFKQFAYAYLEIYRKTVRDSTFHCFERYIRLYMLPVFEDKEIKELEKEDLIDWRDSLLSSKNKIYGCSLSLNTANTAIEYMKQLLKKADEFGQTSNKCYTVLTRFPEVPQKKEEKEIWTIDQFNTFFEDIQDDDLFELIFLLFTTGMRIGEALALTWDCWNKNSIRITKAINSSTNEINECKTENSIRKIYGPKVLQTILEHRKQRLQKKYHFPCNDKDFIFFRIDGRPMCSMTIRARLEKALRKKDYDKISFHNFRHSHASELIRHEFLNSSIDDFLIAERLGLTIDVLHNTYAHIYESDFQSTIHRLSEIEARENTAES